MRHVMFYLLFSPYLCIYLKKLCFIANYSTCRNWLTFLRRQTEHFDQWPFTPPRINPSGFISTKKTRKATQSSPYRSGRVQPRACRAALHPLASGRPLGSIFCVADCFFLSQSWWSRFVYVRAKYQKSNIFPVITIGLYRSGNCTVRSGGCRVTVRKWGLAFIFEALCLWYWRFRHPKTALSSDSKEVCVVFFIFGVPLYG